MIPFNITELGGLCTRGEVTIKSTARFYPGAKNPAAARPGINGGHPFSADLPSVVGHTWPKGKHTLSKKRTFKIKWDCCDNKQNKTILVE